MAIEKYVKAIAATETVSKQELFRFLEIQFARADRNHDGLLDIDELALFAKYVSCPEMGPTLVTPLPAAEVLEGAAKLGLVEVRPQAIAEMQLRERA